MIYKRLLRYEFKNYVCESQQKMRSKFCNVTLVGNDNMQIEAHKVILSGASVFFINMLQSDAHPHPLIFMREVTHEVLKAMLDLIYSGEAYLEEERVDSVVKLNSEVELFGLKKRSRARVTLGGQCLLLLISLRIKMFRFLKKKPKSPHE